MQVFLNVTALPDCNEHSQQRNFVEILTLLLVQGKVESATRLIRKKRGR